MRILIVLLLFLRSWRKEILRRPVWLPYLLKSSVYKMGREVYKKVSKRCDARTRLDDIKREYVHRSASYFSFQEMFSIYDYGEANEERKSFAT